MNSRPYRILMVSTVPLAAPWNGADKNLASLLVRCDPHNQFIVQTSAEEAWAAAPKVTAVREQQAGQMPNQAQKLRSFQYLLRHGNNVDLAHIVASLSRPAPWMGQLLRVWKRLYRKPIVHTVPSVGDQPLQARNFAGDITVVVSEHTRQRLLHHGIPNVVRVPPPVDPQRLRPKTDPEQLQAQLRLGKRAILYPAHYGPDSGIDQIIEAFARFPASLHDAVLVLACRTHQGQDPEHEAQRVMAKAASLGVENRVRVAGHVTDMPALISSCAVTALVPNKLASKMDLPLVILEALALERPVVISDKPPMSEALLDDAGYLVPYGNTSALSDALANLLSDSALRARLAEQGRAAVARECDPAQVVARYQQLYQQAAKTPSHKLDIG